MTVNSSRFPVPYRRMPETGWAVAYLFALSQGSAEDRAELASYCYEAGIDPERLRTEMMSQPRVSTLASPERLDYEIYPLTMAALRVFRASRHYRSEILDKLALGSDAMLDLERWRQRMPSKWQTCRWMERASGR